MSEEKILQEKETGVSVPDCGEIKVPKCQFGEEPCYLDGIRGIPSPVCASCPQHPSYFGSNCPN
jgi:hypothetical protein